MARSNTWICFDCRLAVRRPAWPNSAEDPRCARCGKACFFLGEKIPVPPRRDARAWAELRERQQHRKAALEDQRHQTWVRRRHDLEQRIVHLRTRPTSPGLAREIKLLEQELATLAPRPTFPPY